MTSPLRQRLARWFVALLGSWLLLSTALVTVAVWQKPNQRAVLGMGWGLVVFWILGGGLLMYRLRDQARTWCQEVRLDWRIRFVLFATLLALMEEAICSSGLI